MATPRPFRSRLLLATATTLALVAALEGGARLLGPAGPEPGTALARTIVFNETFYVPDPDLVVRLRPGLESSFALIQPGRDVPVRINARGFRGPAFAPPRQGAFRVLVFGDSVTFGLGLAWADTWPERMAEALAADGRPVQVRNLAVPGYSTLQGRALFEREVVGGGFAPHAVVFAFGFNDGFLRPQDDRTTRDHHRSLAGKIARLARGSRFLSLLLAGAEGEPRVPRVAPGELRDNLRAVAAGCRRLGAECLLVDANIPNGYGRAVFEAVAAEEGAAFLSMRDVLVRAKGLPDEAPWPRGGRVRVEAHSHGVRVPPSGDGRPDFYALLLRDPDRRPRATRLALNDEGRDGDRRAADSVWSCLTPELPAGLRPELAFAIPGLGLAAHADDGAMLNSVHFTALPYVAPEDGEPGTLVVTSPGVLPWPDLVLDPDPIHPTEEGARLIGAALAALVRQTPAWRRFPR